MQQPSPLRSRKHQEMLRLHGSTRRRKTIHYSQIAQTKTKTKSPIRKRCVQLGPLGRIELLVAMLDTWIFVFPLFRVMWFIAEYWYAFLVFMSDCDTCGHLNHKSCFIQSNHIQAFLKRPLRLREPCSCPSPYL